MTSTVAASRITSGASRAAVSRRGPQLGHHHEVPVPPPGPHELDTLASHWQLALDAAQRALAAADGTLPDVGLRQRELVLERQLTARIVAQLAETTGVRPAPWLSAVPLGPKMLGLPAGVGACIFDLDGVLTDSAVLHAQAWAEAFDGFLLRLSERAGWQFIPFDRDADYRGYIDGRSRLEGVHAFLDSRGIHLPQGLPDDPAQAETACGLARRKNQAMISSLQRQGVTALAGARRYLEAAGHAGLGRAVVSASASTMPMLELAGLAPLVEEHVDAQVIRAELLRSRPAPDMLLAACGRLGVRPGEAVTFTHSPAGVAAGHVAGLTVIGVGDEAQAELLRGFGADRVVGSLTVLLDHRLAAAR
jgi:HAD superfamily hydrolase (TIGR01509 family)